MKKTLFLFFTCSVFLNYAQENASIKGNIIDLEVNNEPLIFADIYLQNTNISTRTNFHGNFELNNVNPGNYTLVVRYLGYDTRFIPIYLKESERLEINTGLSAKRPDFEELDLDSVSKDTSVEAKYKTDKKP
ncbi:carboxypeptidase-like regulatory domain-containing protein [Lentiprolixibacter aurantiacus]|uniref:Carboxypeptidase-like regulatory domain-containing protein n=1 Tax=Lentiprolixibacter aurantiacus TaxID=2993939 RepID=A0AAE3MK66_9FLAO|nr:carboxypeptidase-like regulatory domain-containing protein [Lentiprolixibacter aurantiacus]MCX2718718.1 carboxypeptidase-like regulatory domain-containing protein [Lentiprolixibacter aurantiacus]